MKVKGHTDAKNFIKFGRKPTKHIKLILQDPKVHSDRRPSRQPDCRTMYQSDNLYIFFYLI